MRWLGWCHCPTWPEVSFSLLPIISCCPEIVYLQIGENDVSNGKDPSAIANNIVLAVEQLLAHAKRVIVGQLLPLPALQQKRSAIVAVNKLLQCKLSNMSSVKYWRHQNGFWKPVTNLVTGQPRRQLFRSDGIHLTDEGNRRFHYSVSVAVSKAIASLRQSDTYDGNCVMANVVSESEVVADVQADIAGTNISGMVELAGLNDYSMEII
jgi:hypothetical protein